MWHPSVNVCADINVDAHVDVDVHADVAQELYLLIVVNPEDCEA